MISFLLMVAGLLMGVRLISHQNRGLFGVMVIYLVSLVENLYFFLKQAIFVESSMVSGQRMLQMKNLEK